MNKVTNKIKWKYYMWYEFLSLSSFLFLFFHGKTGNNHLCILLLALFLLVITKTTTGRTYHGHKNKHVYHFFNGFMASNVANGLLFPCNISQVHSKYQYFYLNLVRKISMDSFFFRPLHFIPLMTTKLWNSNDFLITLISVIQFLNVYFWSEKKN